MNYSKEILDLLETDHAREQLLDTVGAIEANVELIAGSIDRIAKQKAFSDDIPSIEYKLGRISALCEKLTQ